VSFEILTMTSVGVEAAAALHQTAGLPESWDAESFAALLVAPGIEGRIACAPETGEPVGLVLWRMAADESEILTICVLPEQRRRGAGQALLESAIDALRSRNVARIFLEVAVDNLPAAALYRRLGFRPQGRRPRYYRTASGAVDAIILMKDDLRPSA
jgi:ribosomal-protein-alanine N-acetyltransferase